MHAVPLFSVARRDETRCRHRKQLAPGMQGLHGTRVAVLVAYTIPFLVHCTSLEPTAWTPYGDPSCRAQLTNLAPTITVNILVVTQLVTSYHVVHLVVEFVITVFACFSHRSSRKRSPSSRKRAFYFTTDLLHTASLNTGWYNSFRSQNSDNMLLFTSRVILQCERHDFIIRNTYAIWGNTSATETQKGLFLSCFMCGGTYTKITTPNTTSAPVDVSNSYRVRCYDVSHILTWTPPIITLRERMLIYIPYICVELINSATIW